MKPGNAIVAAATIAATAFALGCASELATAQPAPAPNSTTIVQKIQAEGDDYLWSTSLDTTQVVAPSDIIDRTLVVNVSDGVARACRAYDVPESHFEFDSAKLSRDHNRELRALVQCITSGPLKNRRLRVIGETDPRAGLEESVDLSAHQADTVKDFLTTHGVPGSRVLVTPRGDARAAKQAPLVEERRVDILLAGEALDD